MDVWELIARESIRDLVARYNSNGDSGRFHEVRPLFHDDAEMHLEGEAYIGIEQIMTIFTGTKSRLENSDASGYLRHFGGTHKIEIADQDNASGRLYFFVVTAIGPDHWGVYSDKYRRGSDGTWRFQRRSVKVDGRSPNSLFGN
jgi:SnoaL-like domain